MTTNKYEQAEQIRKQQAGESAEPKRPIATQESDDNSFDNFSSVLQPEQKDQKSGKNYYIKNSISKEIKALSKRLNKSESKIVEEVLESFLASYVRQK